MFMPLNNAADKMIDYVGVLLCKRFQKLFFFALQVYYSNMPSWSNLPEEILQIIFIQPEFRDYNNYYHNDLALLERYNYILQPLFKTKGHFTMYLCLQRMEVGRRTFLLSKRDIFQSRKIIKIVTAFEGKEQERSKFVKVIDFLLPQSETEIFKFLLEPLATMFPYVECLYFYKRFTWLS